MKAEALYRMEFLNRSIPFLSRRGQRILRGKTVAIAGCGGVGGIAAMTLARMGVGRFRLADPGRFDKPDINRQIGATSRTLGKNKARVYAGLLKDVNPYIRTDEFPEGVTPQNVSAFVAKADLLIDCLDLSVPGALRAGMFACARRRGIYGITAPVIGFGALVVCSDPAGMSMEPFVELLGSSREKAAMPEFLYRIFMPEHLDRISEWLDKKKTRVPSIAVGPMAAGGIVSTEAVNALIGRVMPGGRRPVALPRITFVDLFRMSHTVLNAGPLFAKP